MTHRKRGRPIRGLVAADSTARSRTRRARLCEAGQKTTELILPLDLAADVKNWGLKMSDIHSVVIATLRAEIRKRHEDFYFETYIKERP